MAETINRRTFIAALSALATGLPSIGVAACPWVARAVELQPTEHHWADYAAWREWYDANFSDLEIMALDDVETEIREYTYWCSKFPACEAGA